MIKINLKGQNVLKTSLQLIFSRSIQMFQSKKIPVKCCNIKFHVNLKIALPKQN